MWIKNITIENCRLLKVATLNLSQDLNLIIGPNASGKTSLLESLSILSKGRSFRTSHIEEVISENKDTILVSASVIENSSNQSSLTKIGIEKNKNKTRIRIDKQDIYSQAELSAYLPITVIHPSSIDLITGSPAIRRSFLDWIAFYIFPEFQTTWKKYQHILKQRNTCLKSNKHLYALDKWTEELVELQPSLINYRKDVIKLLQTVVDHISGELLNGIKVSLDFNTGFPKDLNIENQSLLDYYKSKQDFDLKSKRTNYGSHRADFNILLNSTPAAECASRGQLKLLAITLLLAQNNCISESNTGNGVILIDDLAAELDSYNKNLLLSYLSKLNKQLIITSTNDVDFEKTKTKVFHVKHGIISEQ